MENYLLRIEELKKKFTDIQGENFKPATSGTRYKVFLSNNYVIRFKDDNPELLLREVDFLEQINHSLVPKVLWSGKIGESIAMVENRLLGETLDIVWKTLTETSQRNIIKQVIEFIQYLETQAKDHIYSVNIGKKYQNFYEYLIDSIEQKVVNIEKNKQTGEILKDLLLILEKAETKNLFLNEKRITMVHGDLIIHNLLTDGKNLTGVLDWEMALFGDSDHDLFRLFYYQECAKAYQEQGVDETFEADYMDKLIKAISESDLIKDKKIFLEKYQFVRASFYLNALYWASTSDSPEKNTNELVAGWNKKSRIKHLFSL